MEKGKNSRSMDDGKLLQHLSVVFFESNAAQMCHRQRQECQVSTSTNMQYYNLCLSLNKPKINKKNQRYRNCIQHY